MSDQESPPYTLFDRFRHTYTPLYRVLLLLGSITAILSLSGVASIRNSLDQLSSDPFYALSGILSILIVLPLMIASLILLWNIHRTGLWLRLVAYGISTVSAVLGFFTSTETIAAITERSIEQARQVGGEALDPSSVASIAEASFYSALGVTIAANVLLAALWVIAWKKQTARKK